MRHRRRAFGPVATAAMAFSTVVRADDVFPGSAVQPGVSPPLTYGSMARANLGVGANLNGSIPFPRDNPWNVDVSRLPVDPNSANLIASIGLSAGLHPDFGSGTYDGALIGIPYVVVSRAQPAVSIRFTDYGDESDPGPYPVPRNAPIEGRLISGAPFGGDRHVLVINRDSNRLYEMYDAFPNPNGSWNAASGAVFHLDSNNVRPTARPGWTSADAAGLPISLGSCVTRRRKTVSSPMRCASR